MQKNVTNKERKRSKPLDTKIIREIKKMDKRDKCKQLWP